MEPLALRGQVSWNFCLRGAEEKRPSLTCQMEPLALSGQVSWNFCLREADEKGPSLTCEHFIEVAPHARRALGAHWVHFPFPREKGSEKGS